MSKTSDKAKALFGERADGVCLLVRGEGEQVWVDRGSDTEAAYLAQGYVDADAEEPAEKAAEPAAAPAKGKGRK
jgi:hypothetical protein